MMIVKKFKFKKDQFKKSTKNVISPLKNKKGETAYFIRFLNSKY